MGKKINQKKKLSWLYYIWEGIELLMLLVCCLLIINIFNVISVLIFQQQQQKIIYFISPTRKTLLN